MNRSAEVTEAMPERGSLLANTMAMYAMQMANYIIPFVTLPFLIRVLGAEQYGAMAIALAVVYFMVLAVDAGVNSKAVRGLSMPGLSLGEIGRIYAANQWIRMAMAGVCLLVLVVLIQVVPSMQLRPSLYLASFMMVIGTLVFPVWLFQGLEVMHVTTFCSVAGRLLVTCCLFLFVRGPEDLVLAVFLQCSATAVSGLLAHLFIRGRLGLRLWMPWGTLWPVIRATFVSTRALWVSELSTNAVANSGVFVLSLFAAEQVVGVYAALEKIAVASLNMFQPLLKALFPKVAASWHGNQTPTYVRMWTLRLVVLALVATVMLLLLGPWGITFLFGDQWVVHAPLLKIIALWLLVAVTGATASQLWLLAAGHHHVYSRILVAGAVAQLLLSVAGAVTIGPAGILLAMLGAECLRLVFSTFTLKFSVAG